jgi:hypothetical protein
MLACQAAQAQLLALAGQAGQVSREQLLAISGRLGPEELLHGATIDANCNARIIATRRSIPEGLIDRTCWSVQRPLRALCIKGIARGRDGLGLHSRNRRFKRGTLAWVSRGSEQGTQSGKLGVGVVSH